MSDQFPRDWFPTEAEPDPMRAAQASMRAPRPKRFYEEAAVEPREGEFHLVLDGRPARTPGRRPLAVPHRDLAEAVAAEWARQGAEIDPASMPVTRIVNSALDGVAGREEEVKDDLVRYAGSDLVCYRAATPERLVAAQNAAWNPVLDWAGEALGVRFALSEGVMHVRQPEETQRAVRAALAADASPLRLAALHVMTTLTGSVLIPLAHAAGVLTEAQAWDAAHVDEHHQESVWGEDAEALRRRRAREAEFRAASLVYRLASV
jgi:chaperone required for assembly of F1-ATPase